MARYKFRRRSGHTWAQMSSQNLLDLKRRGFRRVPIVRHSTDSARREPPRRRSTLRERRRRTRALWFLAALLIIAGIAYGVSYLSYLPQFTVTDVTVTGTQVIPSRVVVAYVETILYDGSYHFLSRQNILLYPKLAIESALVKNFPRVASATLSRRSLLAQAVNVTITERQPLALWCVDGTQSGECYVMDNGGFIYASAATSTPTSGEYTFSGGVATSSPVIGQTFATGHVLGMIALFKLLSQEDNLTPTGAAVLNDRDFDVSLSQGFSIKASFGENADTLSRDLGLILSSDALQGRENELQYIDLRFGDRVYYKLTGEAATSTTH